MLKHARMLGLVILLLVPAGLQARDKKITAAERVAQLIVILQTDKDEEKRSDAAEQLRYVDPAKHAEIVPALLNSMKTDPKASVRSEAAYSLSRLRPVSQEIGAALEEAQHDNSMRVRWQARNALLAYRIAGYRSAPKEKEVVQKTPAPSKLQPVPKATPSIPTATTAAATPKKPVVLHSNGESAPPPLAESIAIPQSSTKPIEPPSLILPGGGPNLFPDKPKQ